MKKFLILLVFVFSQVLILGQGNEKQNPNVELPDFVITGKDVISLQKANKLEPGFISTISEEFIRPVYSPEDLPVKDFSNPITQQTSLTDSQKVYNSRLKVVSGLYTSPAGRFSFTQPFSSNVLLDAEISGENHRAYVDNSGWSNLNGGLNLAFFMPNNTSLHGTQFKLHGDYGLTWYRFFASDNPAQPRNFYQGNFSASVNNLVSRQFNFELNAADKYSSLSTENFKEHLLLLKGFLSANFSYLKLAGNINYTKQFITNNITFNFFSVRPYAEFNLQTFFKLAAGLSYSNSGSRNFLEPYASAAFKLNDFVSVFAEYNPSAEFFSAGEFLRQNRYFNPQNFINANAFVRKKSAFDAVLKYEYYKYFEIDAGVKYFRADDFPYFTNSLQKGRFDISLTSAKNYSAFVNLLFHQGPHGVFYGTAEYNDTKDFAGNVLPYSPKLKATMSYGYRFDFGLYVEPKMYFSSVTFSDINNTDTLKIAPYFNLGIKFTYSLIKNFSLTAELSNFKNRINYFKWFRYDQEQIDFVAGFTYKW